MEYWIGIALALLVVGMGAGAGFDRERAFYPVVLIVVASYYALFAAMGASGQVIVLESVAAGAFVLLAVIGFKTNLWFVVAGLFGHGTFDFVHHRFITNQGVPRWWPGFCLAADGMLGVYLAILLVRRRRGSAGKTIAPAD
jgi:hypothetical protein